MCIFFYIYMIHKDDAQTLYTKDAKFLGIIKNLPPHYYDAVHIVYFMQYDDIDTVSFMTL